MVLIFSMIVIFLYYCFQDKLTALNARATARRQQALHIRRRMMLPRQSNN